MICYMMQEGGEFVACRENSVRQWSEVDWCPLSTSLDFTRRESRSWRNATTTTATTAC